MLFVGLVFVGIIIFILVKPKNSASKSPINIDKDTLGDMVGIYLRTRSTAEIHEAINTYDASLERIGTVNKNLIKTKLWNVITSEAHLKIFWTTPLSMIAYRSQVLAENTRYSTDFVNQIGQEIYFLYLLWCTLYLINNPQLQTMVNTPQSHALEKRTAQYMK